MIPKRALKSLKSFPVKGIPEAGGSIGKKFMSVRSFFDTNILVYTDDKAAPSKQRHAVELIAEHRRAGSGVVSLQVLQEYFVTVTAN